jgi:hypothetical protein
MRLRVMCVLCVAVLVLLPLTGCGAIAEKAVETSTGVDIDEGGDSVTVTGDDGETVEIQGGDDASLPKGFPEDVPVYEDADIKMGNSMTSDGKTTYSVTLQTSDDVDTASAWYKDALPKEGWSLEGDMTSTASGQSITVIGAKKGTMALNVSVMGPDDDSKTTISLIVAPES